MPINKTKYHKGHKKNTIYLRLKIICLYLFQIKPRYSLLDKVVTINIVHKLKNHIGITYYISVQGKPYMKHHFKVEE